MVLFHARNYLSICCLPGIYSIFSRSPERKIEQQQRKTRFQLNCVPADFMSNETNKLALIYIIEEIEACRETQTNVDVIYTINYVLLS